MGVLGEKDDKLAGQCRHSAGGHILIENNIVIAIELAARFGAGCTLGPAETFGPGDHHLYVDITVMRLESSLFGTFERMGAHHHKEVVALNDVFPVESRIGHFVEVAVEIFKQLREKRMQRFVVSFKIAKNITAPVGEKYIYVRLMKPDDDILVKSRADVFEFEGKEINYSMKKLIEYEGEEVQVVLYWDIEEFLSPGTYRADIFADGNLIGRKNFTLED